MANCIDLQALQAINALQRTGEPDLLTRIVKLFNSESPKSIAALQNGLDPVDLEAVCHAAHTLKFSSACLHASTPV